ncbi:MAG: hypothetical protein Q9185_005334 [Variospora sp. 1 TL-2023]
MPSSMASNRALILPPNDVIVIDHHGDLILHVKYCQDIFRRYRVSTSVLCSHSFYFSALLDSAKFSEGMVVESKLAELRKQYPDIGKVPAQKLPVVTLSDVGVGPKTAVSSSEEAFRLCLGILHESPLLPTGNKARVRFIYALLAHYAEVYAATAIVAKHVESRWPDHLCKASDPSTVKPTEIKIRQELYMGLVLGFRKVTSLYSAVLVVLGSRRWAEGHDDHSTTDDGEYPWDYLLGGVEDYFLGLYNSREEQCKLRYDSSRACDYFQMGEMIRFFTRKGTLALQCTLSGSDGKSEAYRGSLVELLRALRDCPSYQIDKNHTHCGLRTRFIPRLNLIEPLKQVGLCLRCWKHERRNESWLEYPTTEKWWCGFHAVDQTKSQCGAIFSDHQAKLMYTASVRDWSGERPT